MNPTTSRALLLALALGVALTHLGCSYELVLETDSGRTRFEQGETVVIEVFDGDDRITASKLGGTARIRWSVRNQNADAEYRDLGYGDELITSQLEPGRNWVYADIEGDTSYPLRADYGGISIEITKNGVLPAPPPTPAAPDPTPAAAPPAPSASPSPNASSGPAAPTGGLVGGLGGSQ